MAGIFSGTKSSGGVLGKTKSSSGIFSKATSPKIETSDDLYNIAVNTGLKNDADRIVLSQEGEKQKEIWSGGLFSDIIDVLNVASYGVVGMIKGKSFAEGVKTRQSFTDQDALGKFGIPGVVLGIGLDIITDPFTYIAPTTIIKKVPGATKLLKGLKEAVFGKVVTKAIEESPKISKIATQLTEELGEETAQKIIAQTPELKMIDEVAEELAPKTYQTLEGGTKMGKYLGEKFSWMFGADPVYKEIFERGLTRTAVETTKLGELAKGLTQLTPDIAKKILTKDKKNRIIRESLEKLQTILNPQEFEVVSTAWNKIDDLGRQAVDAGLLSKTKFEENFGEYIKNAYDEFELAKSKNLFGVKIPGIKGIKKRVEGLTPEKMAELGQIDNPSYLVFKSTFDLAKDVENAKMFKEIGEKFATNKLQKGFTKLPEGKRLGVLAGKYVPDNMYKYLNEIITPNQSSLTKDLVSTFKLFKVVMNPATHARNIVSNTLLNWWKLGIGPWRADLYAEAIKQAKYGGKWVDEATKVGYNTDTFISQELKSLLDSPEASQIGSKLGKQWNRIKKTMGDFYQQEENVAKLAAFIGQRKRGMGIEEAWKTAESATFNYAQVTPFVRKLRESLFGFPFVTFTVKSTPVVIETALKHPGRISVIGKIKQGIEQQADIKETARERASEPPYIRDGFYVKLPIKDKNGRSSYFDLTYIIPFGDLVSGQLLNRQINRETGTVESIPSTAASNSPLFNLIKELSKNQDFYGDKIWNDSSSTQEQLGDIMRHLTKTYLPPLVADQIPGGYTSSGERRKKGFAQALSQQDQANQQRTLQQEILRNFGIKIQPINADLQESYKEWNKKRALETLFVVSLSINCPVNSLYAT